MADEGEALEGVPVPELFRRATAVVEQVETKPWAAPERRELLQQGLRLLRLASKLVDAAGLFSPNEDKDDIATNHLRYLLIPYYLGELLSQADPGGGHPAARRAALASAVEQYMQFLHRSRNYGLLGSEAAAMLEQLEEEGGESGEDGGSGSSRADPAVLRQNKILKFKRERAIKARLEAIQQQRRRPARGGGGGEAEAEAEEDEWGAEDDEWEREAWLLQLDLAGLKAAEKVGTARQEMQLLAHAASLPEEERSKPRPPPPPELKAKLMAAVGALQGEQGKRQQLQSEVFRPSHALPSMTVEQWGEVELRQMREREQAEAQRAERERAERAARTEDEQEEIDLRKQREWDDWKDDNPKGWGNSKSRPCG